MPVTLMLIFQRAIHLEEPTPVWTSGLQARDSKWHPWADGRTCCGAQGTESFPLRVEAEGARGKQLHHIGAPCFWGSCEQFNETSRSFHNELGFRLISSAKVWQSVFLQGALQQVSLPSYLQDLFGLTTSLLYNLQWLPIVWGQHVNSWARLEWFCWSFAADNHGWSPCESYRVPNFSWIVKSQLPAI